MGPVEEIRVDFVITLHLVGAPYCLYAISITTGSKPCSKPLATTGHHNNYVRLHSRLDSAQT